MPYIKVEDRQKLVPHLDLLLKVMKEAGFLGAGHMNYAITYLLKEMYPESRGYKGINEAMGVLNCVSAEYYRRLAAPFEETKIQENGDVY